MDDQYSPMAFGRILERLDQQDRNSASISRELAKETVRLAEETKANSERMTSEIIASGDRFSKSLEKHTAEDTERFGQINMKLDTLIAFQEKQKGIASVLMLCATAVSALVGWLVSYFSK